MRSNPGLCGMCRDLEPKGLNEQAVGHSSELSRQTRTGAGRSQVSGLARMRARQDLAAALTTPARPGSCQAAGPQDRDRSRDLAALDQGRYGRAERQAPQRRTTQARRGGCRASGAMGALAAFNNGHRIAASAISKHRAVPVEVNTLIRALKANGLVWKCKRHLKKSETPTPSPSPAKSSKS